MSEVVRVIRKPSFGVVEVLPELYGGVDGDNEDAVVDTVDRLLAACVDVAVESLGDKLSLRVDRKPKGEYVLWYYHTNCVLMHVLVGKGKLKYSVTFWPGSEDPKKHSFVWYDFHRCGFDDKVLADQCVNFVYRLFWHALNLDYLCSCDRCSRCTSMSGRVHEIYLTKRHAYVDACVVCLPECSVDDLV